MRRSQAAVARGMLCGAAWSIAGAMAVLGANEAKALSDQRDFEPMFNALNELMQFAAPGRSVNWGNQVTGNSGKITATGQVNRSGRLCWAYDRTFSDGASVKLVEGVSCEKFPGLWEIVDEGTERVVSGASSSGAGSSGAGSSGAGSGSVAQKPATSPAKTQTAAKPKSPSYSRNTVRETQSLLTSLGYNPGPIDGAFGSKTRRAIERFERDEGQSVTGVPSEALVARLRDAETRRAAATAPQNPATSSQPSASSTAASTATSTGTTGTGATAAEPASPGLLEAAPPIPSLESDDGASSSGDSGSLSGLPPPPPPPPSN